MNTPSNRIERDAKIQQLREKFENDGYEVVVEPENSALPFDLNDYSPALLVKKPGGGGFIVEVKTAHARTSLERYQALANIVRQSPGWRFLLITVDDLNVPTHADEMVEWDALAGKLEATRSLIDSHHEEAAVLYLWSIFEAAIRKLAIAEALPIERLPALKMLNQLYTIGYISVDEFATAKKFLAMRNNIAYGFRTSLDTPLLASFFHIAFELVAEWRERKFESSLDFG